MQGLGHTTSEYEFKTTENAVIEDLAAKMRFVGMMGIILGVLFTVTGGGGIALGRLSGAGAAANLLQGVLALLVGVWTRSAAGGFQRIVDTQGHDIANLMGALGELRRIYTLQRVLFVAVLVVFVLAIQLAFLLLARGTPV
jgi:hypothetical protein